MRRFLVALTLISIALISAVALFAWPRLRAWDAVVTERFRDHRWALPSKIFAARALLYPGLKLEPDDLQLTLERAGYRATEELPLKRGEFNRSATETLLAWRDSGSAEAPETLRLQHGRDHVITRIQNMTSGEELTSIALEPKMITAIFQGNWQERRLVTLAEVPPRLVHAILDTEDQRFYSHHGVDGFGLLRAVWANLTSRSLRQGGSTLTQQLMKNFFLTDERSFTRKRRELVMALIVEYRFSKEEILENYLNEIYLGQRGAQAIHGVHEAARHYFAKDLDELSTGEMALIAGIIRGPNIYSPLRHPERARVRRDVVLNLMHEEGHLTQEEYEAALAEPLRTAEVPVHADDAPYFVDFVRQELAENYATDVLSAEGLSIETTLDPRLQQLAEEVLQDGLDELERKYRRLRSEDPSTRLQGCLLAVEPHTGAIRAMMGGRDYRFTQFNRCTQAQRQPGSTFKPFVYAAAFETRDIEPPYLPTSIVDDEPFTWSFEGRSWAPANYDKQYSGPVRLRQALELSLNAATARIAHQVGLPAVIDTARRLGITSPLAEYPSIVLGAAEVSPLEIAQAYSVLANGGVRAEVASIRRVRAHGNIALERRPIRFEQVISAESAFLVTHLLEGVLQRGTGRAVRSRGWSRPAAGKTGTTSDYHDAWFAGYTPDLVTVVWVGFDDPKSLGLTGGDAALPIWTNFMRRAVATRPEQGFVAPPGIAVVRIDPASGELATADCPETLDEAFPIDAAPTAPCALHSPPAEPPAAESEIDPL